MTREEVLDEFRRSGALLEGHFLLTSGLHSQKYIQCARVLMDPRRSGKLCKALARKIRLALGDDKIDLVVSPALGGIVVGYEVARHLGVRAIFTERENDVMVLRRGFEILKGEQVVLVEDVVTTGRSSRESIACAAREGAQVLAAGCLIDRSDGAADLGVPLVALARLSIPAYEADALPQELARIPAVKPGSRRLA